MMASYEGPLRGTPPAAVHDGERMTGMDLFLWIQSFGPQHDESRGAAKLQALLDRAEAPEACEQKGHVEAYERGWRDGVAALASNLQVNEIDPPQRTFTCVHCGDPVVRHPGNGGQWLGANPPRDWAACHGLVDGQKHEVR